MAHLTREEILARKTGRGKVILQDGSSVAIRALTRDEAITMQEMTDLAAADNFCISTAMTDPKLSADDVAAWAAQGDAGDLAQISEAIAVLSKMKRGSAKEATKSTAD